MISTVLLFTCFTSHSSSEDQACEVSCTKFSSKNMALKQSFFSFQVLVLDLHFILCLYEHGKRLVCFIPIAIVRAFTLAYRCEMKKNIIHIHQLFKLLFHDELWSKHFFLIEALYCLKHNINIVPSHPWYILCLFY